MSPLNYLINYIKFNWIKEEINSEFFGLTPYEIFVRKHEYIIDSLMSMFKVKYNDIEELEYLAVKYGGLSFTETQEMPFYKLNSWLKRTEEHEKKKREQEEKEQAKYKMKDYNPNSYMKNAQKYSNYKQPKLPKK